MTVTGSQQHLESPGEPPPWSRRPSRPYDTRWRGPDFLSGSADDGLGAAQADCWDHEADRDELRAAAAVDKSEADTIFVKLPPGLRRADLRGKSYLDLGCGYGRTLLYAARELGPSVAIGVDISSVMLSKARDYADDHGLDPVLARAGIDRIPLPDESVDFVYSSAVLLHLPEEMVRAAVSEALRVLRPGGVALFERCLIGWANPEGVQNKLIARFGRRLLRVAFVRTYRRRDIERIVRDAGPVSRAEIVPEGYKVLPKSLFTRSLGRLKPPIERLNRRASRRLRFKGFLVESWSVRLVK